MKVALWSPLPPAPSGVADYVAEQLEELARHVSVQAVVAEPGEARPHSWPGVEIVGPADARADLHVYHLGNSPGHAYAYRAALEVPGVAYLHEWNLHHLVLLETVERGEVGAYLREMRRAHGEKGTFVGRQVARGLGGELFPALLPLNDRVLESSLAVVTLTRSAAGLARRRLSGRPVLALPLHYTCPLDPPPSREDARRALGIPRGALVVCAPGLATGAKRLDLLARAVARLRGARPGLRLIVAGATEGTSGVEEALRAADLGDALVVTGRLGLLDFVRHLAAADVVSALRFPSHGEMSAALVRALGLGRATLVSAGTPAGLEFPDGVVVEVVPGPGEEDELCALLGRLLDDEPLRSRIGALAREHVVAHHGLARTTRELAGFLRSVEARKDALRSALDRDRDEGSLDALFREELRWAVRDLGLGGFRLAMDLFGPRGVRS